MRMPNHGQPPHHQKPNALISRIIVHCGSLVDKIDLVHPNGNVTHTGRQGGQRQAPFDLKNNEHIILVNARTGQKTDSVQFVTNLGRSTPKYGGNGGNQVTFRARSGFCIVGLHVGQGTCPKINGIREHKIPNHQPSNQPYIPPNQQPYIPPNQQPYIPQNNTQPGGVVKKVTHVTVHCGNLIDQITFHYAGGQRSLTGQNGGQQRQPFRLQQDEFITELHARNGGKCDSVQFITNKGRKSEYYGGRGGQPVVFRAAYGNCIIGVTAAQGSCPRITGITQGVAYGVPNQNQQQQPQQQHLSNSLYLQITLLK
eukprot:UN23373